MGHSFTKEYEGLLVVGVQVTCLIILTRIFTCNWPCSSVTFWSGLVTQLKFKLKAHTPPNVNHSQSDQYIDPSQCEI